MHQAVFSVTLLGSLINVNSPKLLHYLLHKTQNQASVMLHVCAVIYVLGLWSFRPIFLFLFFITQAYHPPLDLNVYLPCLYILMTEAMLNFKECKFHVQSSFFFTQCYLTSCTMLKKDLKVISYLQFCVLCLHVRKGC